MRFAKESGMGPIPLASLGVFDRGRGDNLRRGNRLLIQRAYQIAWERSKVIRES
jgi:hypothetical protein